ncbi:MAG: methyltransferase domain-containing protein [Lachnospiraceae bacterium]|nr:methyltransferase domain-containing protein [Lachnospiraceae bacterium]
MFWDNVAGVYDIFTNIINKKTHKGLCERIGELIFETEEVLECACGTGLLSGIIGKKCKKLVATDFSAKMLKKASKKHSQYNNIEFKKGNILQIEYPNETFDVVVAANVIHLLDEPYKALAELDRVCRKGGRIIIPTYMNKNDSGKTSGFASTVGKVGVDFKRQFTFETYKKFIEDAGYQNVEYTLINGRIPCAVAVIVK